MLLGSMGSACLGLSPASIMPELMTADDVAELMRVSRRTVFRLRRRGLLPPPVNLSDKLVRWRWSDLRDFLTTLTPRQTRRHDMTQEVEP
jgi:predicted DNA-binding transcriptional regulator AlpA